MIEYAQHIINESIKEKVFASYRLPTIKTLGNGGYKYMYHNSKCEIHIDLKNICDEGIKAISNDFDNIWAITGMEGSAKSTFVITNIMTYICHVLGTSFTVDNICFNVEELDKAIDTLPVGSVISLDEFVLMGSSDESMTRLQRLLRKKFTLIRKKRLFIFLVMPSIYMMNKYFAIARTRYLLHCVLEGCARGTVRYYGYGKKNYMVVNGRKHFTYDGFKYDRQFRFLDLRNNELVGQHIIDWQEYEKKKDKALKSLGRDEQEVKEDNKLKRQEITEESLAQRNALFRKVREERFKIIDMVVKNKMADLPTIAKLTGTSLESVRHFYYANNLNKPNSSNKQKQEET